jgi:hypothetical protein
VWRASIGIFVLLAAALAGCNAPPPVPSVLGGLPLTHALQGDDALSEVSRLHGKRVLARDGFVAHYERDGAVAMLYVSRAHLGVLARWQLSRMVKGIEQGQANAEGRFFHLKSRERDGLMLYSVLGLGQIHYFYQSGATIVWLAADPPIAGAALAEAIRFIR